MRLDLKDIIHVPGSQLPFEYQMDLSELDFYGICPFVESVKVNGCVRNRAGLLELDCEATSNLHLRCDSCGKPFQRAMTVPVQYMLATELEKEEDDIILLEGTELDLDSLMNDEIIFAMDTKNLCQEDCKGRCPKCGKNLNEGPCDCKPELDSRFAVLAKLLQQDE